MLLSLSPPQPNTPIILPPVNDLAVKLAKDGDTVLVLGKGHESGQDFKGLVTPFDDRIELAESIKRGMKS